MTQPIDFCGVSELRQMRKDRLRKIDKPTISKADAALVGARKELDACRPMVCTICGSPAEFIESEQVWRHAGKPYQKGFDIQSFCDKYGYPISVEEARKEPNAST